ncbi:shikimate dehydrogenase [Alkalicoccus halolimnae]|uniref:Shikimate dehydrogenase (NADP(+)) n=1 Tax=Alkalicoccus halolimnae TaxID=1667239 RepID=A0A5C7FGN7_9BACI|nr:shikimate dehydrogenase [Alkalicoccus halolimnae]TXF86467.1 shikimate dehydrogenase [Alkalicoccus halolimnae]
MTQVFGVIGDPIGHTLSPLMHTSAYRDTGISASYVSFNVKQENLEDAVKGIRGLGINGVNVTVPHKIEVMKYVDELDETAKRIGAVNTIVNDKKQNKLIGYNTDGEGYLRSLQSRLRKPFRETRVLLIGAGGAGRAVAVTLAHKGVKQLTIANRTVASAEALAEDCGGETRALSLGTAQASLMEFDVVINSTSVGMAPGTGQMPISLEKLASRTLVSDLIYNPWKTRFLKEADKKGAETLNGVGMFVHQGALSFELWTGVQAPVKIMERTVTEKLREV